MSDQNIIPINNDFNDTVTNKLFVTVEGDEIQIDYASLDLTFESSEQEIMNKLVPMVQEERGIDISDSYKVRKSTQNQNIFIIPNSTAG